MEALAVKVQDGGHRDGTMYPPCYKGSVFPDQIGVSPQCTGCMQFERCTDYILNELYHLRP